MISIVLLALVLLFLPSCQLQPESRSASLNDRDLGFDASAVPSNPKNRHKTKKTARQYVRKGYRLLLVGNEREARRALQAALRLSPQHQQAALLLQQIEGDPTADFGAESFDYRIRPNDTLTELAQRFLGDPLKFYLLAKYNKLSNPSRITVGQVIKIPGAPDVSPEPLLKPEAIPPPPAVAEPTATLGEVDEPLAPPAAVPPSVEPQAPLAQPDTSSTTVPEAAPSPAPPAAAPLGRHYAVVIGIDAYAHLGQLETAVTDAMAITQVLEVQYGFNVIFLPDATRTDIVQVLENLRTILTPPDSLLIYYAGHGILDENERGYWLPQDALPDSRSAWLATAEITEVVKAMAARHVMVIADSCYSGTGSRNGAAESPANGETRQVDLKHMDALRSRTVMTSGGLKPVSNRDGGQYSVFAKAFLTALYINSEVLEGQRLFTKMLPWFVVNSSPTPVYANISHAEHGGGDFLFVPRSHNSR